MIVEMFPMNKTVEPKELLSKANSVKTSAMDSISDAKSALNNKVTSIKDSVGGALSEGMDSVGLSDSAGGMMDELAAAKKGAMEMQTEVMSVVSEAKAEIGGAVGGATGFINDGIGEVNSLVGDVNAMGQSFTQSALLKEAASQVDSLCDFDMSGLDIDLGFGSFLDSLNLSLNMGNIDLFDSLMNCAKVTAGKIDDITDSVMGIAEDLSSNGQIKEFASIADTLGLDGIADETKHITGLAKSLNTNEDIAAFKNVVGSFSGKKEFDEDVVLKPFVGHTSTGGDVKIYDVAKVKEFAPTKVDAVCSTLTRSQFDIVDSYFN